MKEQPNKDYPNEFVLNEDHPEYISGNGKFRM